MKKILKLTAYLSLFIALTACEDRVVTTTTTTVSTDVDSTNIGHDEVQVSSTLVKTHNDGVLCSKYVVDGVEYLIFTQDHSYNAPFVVNHTKDKLELRLLKDNLKARNLDTE